MIPDNGDRLSVQAITRVPAACLPLLGGQNDGGRDSMRIRLRTVSLSGKHSVMSQSNQAGWRGLLPGCFGIADLKFARHPLDEEKAKTMIREALRMGASSEDIMTAIRWFLASEHASEEHIEKEILHSRKVIRAVI